MSPWLPVTALFVVFAIPLVATVQRQKRRLRRLFDFSDNRSEASRGVPDAAPLEVVAMFEAAARGEVTILDDAVKSHVPVDVREGVGQTPLLVAAHGQQLGAVAWLIAHGADVDAQDALGESAILKAARRGAVPIVRMLIDARADVEPVHVGGWTPVSVATLHGHKEIVAMLAEAGAKLP